jgi:hypothetical protein
MRGKPERCPIFTYAPVAFLLSRSGDPESQVRIALAGLTLGAAAFAQTKWDLPTAYPPPTTTENIAVREGCDAAAAGKLKVTVHANARSSRRPRSSG